MSLGGHFKVEAFSRLNFEKQRFQALTRLHEWDDKKKIEAFRLALTGLAELWFEALPKETQRRRGALP